MTSGWLPPVERIVRSVAGLSSSAPPFTLVEAARGESRSLPTLLSIWEREDRPLPDSLRAELSYARQRLADYRDALAAVRRVEPSVAPLKGPAIWDRYPDGIVRETADLDLWLPSAEALWRVARHFADSGWVPDVVWAWRIAGGVQFHLVVKRPGRVPLLMGRDRVELTTIAYQGNHVRREPRLRRWDHGGSPTAADCLVWLLEELGERRARMRDVLDLAILVEAAVIEDPGAFAEESACLVARYRLLTPLRQLLALAKSHYPEATALLTRVRSAIPRRSALRMPWPVRRHPAAAVLAAAVATARTDRSPAVLRAAADDLLLHVQRRVPLPRLLGLGLPLYGMPLPRSQRAEGVTAAFDEVGTCRLDTPVGRFVGTFGPALDEAWVERVTASAGEFREVRLL